MLVDDIRFSDSCGCTVLIEVEFIFNNKASSTNVLFSGSERRTAVVVSGVGLSPMLCEIVASATSPVV